MQPREPAPRAVTGADLQFGHPIEQQPRARAVARHLLGGHLRGVGRSDAEGDAGGQPPVPGERPPARHQRRVGLPMALLAEMPHPLHLGLERPAPRAGKLARQRHADQPGVSHAEVVDGGDLDPVVVGHAGAEHGDGVGPPLPRLRESWRRRENQPGRHRTRTDHRHPYAPQRLPSSFPASIRREAGRRNRHSRIGGRSNGRGGARVIASRR